MPRSVSGSEDPACQGREHRKGPHEWKLLWVTEDGPLHGWIGTSSLGGYTALASSGHVKPCAGPGVGTRVSTTGATEVTLRNCPISLRVHQSGCGVVKRSYPRGSSLSAPKRGEARRVVRKGRSLIHPPRIARDAGTRYGSHGWQTSVEFILAHQHLGQSRKRLGRGPRCASARRKRVLAPWTVFARGEKAKG